MRRALLVLLLVSLAHAGEPAALETAFVLAGHGARVRCVAFRPDGAVVASGSPDRTLRLWSLEKRELIASHVLESSG